MSRGIVIGYDGSEPAKAALELAVELGHAYGEPVTVAFGYDLSPVGGELHDYHTALKEFADARVAEARSLAATGNGDAGTVETIVVERAPAEALVALARERDARMIVIGTYGEGPLRGALLGSTAHKLLHLSDRPVVVVPAAT